MAQPGGLCPDHEAGGWALTFVAVTMAMIFFRAATLRSAVDWSKALWRQRSRDAAQRAAVAATYGTDIEMAAIWIAVLLFIALVCPNTLEMLAPYEPARVEAEVDRADLGGFESRPGVRRCPGRWRYRSSPRSPSSPPAARANSCTGNSSCGASRLRGLAV